MQCNFCGTFLPVGAKHCPFCGAPVSQPGPLQESLSPPPVSQADRTVRAGPSNLQAERVMPAEPYDPPVPLASSANAYPPPPYYANSQQPPYVVPQPPPSPPQRQPPRSGRGLSRGMIALIVLALLLMCGGVGLIYYTTVSHPAQLHAQATATAQTQQTREAQATAQANAQATGTAVAYANATATAQAQATAEVVATATALQNIYNSATAGAPALNDALSGNTASNWDEDQAQGGGGCTFTGGAYHASLFSRGFYFPCFARNTNFSDLAFQVQMTITQGDAGGLIFRANSSANKFYIFLLGSDGTYDLFISQDNNHSLELAYGSSPAIHKYAGHTNLITAIARGNNIYLYVNKQYISSVSDATYKSGQIGVFAEDRTNPTNVAFSNAQVWKL